MNQTQTESSFDFVHKYVKLLARITDAPTDFLEAAALFLLSVSVGRKWMFRSIPETPLFFDNSKISGRLLNLWFILIGKSRITRKTSGVINRVIEMLKRTFEKPQMISEAFTPEALIEQMSNMSKSSVSGELETVCSWIGDEIAWFFQQLRKRDSYMTSTEALLSKIYDSSTYSRSTISRGTETIPNPYLTCLLASTEYLPTLFDELQIRLGFMNRFIYVIGERKDRKPLRTEPLTREETEEALKIEAFLRALNEKTSVTILEMANDAKELYDSFESRIENQIESEDLDLKEGYCGQLPNLVIRLSCIYRISRMTIEEIRSYSNPVLLVERQDVERAIDYAQKAWNWFEKIVQIMQTSKPSSMSQTDLTKKLVLEALKDEAEHSRREIVEFVLSRLRVSVLTIDNALRKLCDDNRIYQPRYGFYKQNEGSRAGQQHVDLSSAFLIGRSAEDEDMRKERHDA